MSAASYALRASLITALKASASLITLLGGEKIFDETPASTAFPYIHVGSWEVKDWSTDTDFGHEHRVTLIAYARNGGKAEVERISEEVLHILDDMPLTLTGHRLVNIRFTTAEFKREKDGRTVQAVMRMRAVTEVLP